MTDNENSNERDIVMSENMLRNVKLNHIQIHDSFWNKYIGLVEEVILPFQWELINDRVEGAEKSGCIRNFRIAAGEIAGEHEGMVFQDTDVAKWLEAVGFSLAKKRNGKLEKTADEAIDLIARAQCEDGYLNTYYTITGKPRWSDLFEGHELYTAGHFIEAAVAYYEATGKEKLLNVVCKFVDHIYEVFGSEEGKCHGYPGHPEIELALVKLYRTTGEKKYLKLADYFVRVRGERPCYFLTEEERMEKGFLFPEFEDFGMDYAQAHVPLAEQTTAEGHAVRAVYLYSAMADLAGEYKDEQMLAQCGELWENIVEKRMYITGSIGSAAFGERFTTDYDLPNNTNYSESCASIGLAMFSNRMFQATRDGKYMDIVEKALYNTLLSGIAMDGRHFFYVNPLEVVPEVAEKNPTMRHIKTLRQKWFGVACCPPNIARTLASMGNYMYDVGGDTLYSNLFINSEITAEVAGGDVTVKLSADYPRTGDVVYTFLSEEARAFTLAIRKPGFSEHISVRVNGADAEYTLEKGYVYLNREWQPQDKATVTLNVDFRFVRCNPRVRDNIGKLALMKGPWVYCLEEADNGNYLNSVKVKADCDVLPIYDEHLLGGTLCAVFEGEKIDYGKTEDALYVVKAPDYVHTALKAIPYCQWNNRGKGEMLVWMREA